MMSSCQVQGLNIVWKHKKKKHNINRHDRDLKLHPVITLISVVVVLKSSFQTLIIY